MNEVPAAPMISVVVAVRNGARTLQRCLDSVFEQRFSGVELIVIDGGSNDGTQAVLQRNAARIQYWESERDRGIYHAWNKALAHARGKWICFLGSDDRFSDPDALSVMNEALIRAEGHHRVVYATIDIVDETGAIVGTAGQPWDEVRDEFRNGMVFDHGSTFHHRSLFDRHGGFDEHFRVAGDYEMLLRELLDHDPMFVPGLVVVQVAAGGISDRPEWAGTSGREKHRARYMHGLTDVPEWRSFQVLRVVFRAWLTRSFGLRTADAVGDVYRAVTRKPKRTRRS